MGHYRTAVIAAAALLLGGRPLAAQIDYRNLDEGRPAHTEDAYPVERYAFELLTPWSLDARPGGTTSVLLTPELEYGAFMNSQVGIAAPLGWLHAAGTTDFGLAGVYAKATKEQDEFNVDRTVDYAGLEKATA